MRILTPCGFLSRPFGRDPQFPLAEIGTVFDLMRMSLYLSEKKSRINYAKEFATRIMARETTITSRNLLRSLKNVLSKYFLII